MSEEKIFAKFITECHGDESIDIMLDPLLYIYYRDSIEFAVYKLHYYRNILFLSICKLLRIDKICEVIAKWTKSK